jgi:hypothetical protein
VPPGQLRSAEVHRRNAEKKAHHDAAKGRPDNHHQGKVHGKGKGKNKDKDKDDDKDR